MQQRAYCATYLEFCLERLSWKNLKTVERIADNLFRDYGIDVKFTKHFIERINDIRNKPDIQMDELILIFKNVADSLGVKFEDSHKMEAVIIHIASQINLPFVLQPNKGGDSQLILKTVFRKPNFKTTNRIYRV